MKIKVEKFLMKQGNRVGKAAIEFEPTDGHLAGFHLLGFTICDDEQKGMFVLFPAVVPSRRDQQDKNERSSSSNRPFFFLRPSSPDTLDKLENEILDIYESMSGAFNKPRLKSPQEEKQTIA